MKKPVERIYVVRLTQDQAAALYEAVTITANCEAPSTFEHARFQGAADALMDQLNQNLNHLCIHHRLELLRALLQPFHDQG